MSHKNSPVPVPVIDITDLYHPHQDIGDNFDLLLPFAMHEQIDLLAVIMDCTKRFRESKADHPNPHYRDLHGPRDPGFVPLAQLNYLFGRNVPSAVGPFEALKDPRDTMCDAPRFQQLGIELILDTLEGHPESVDITVFGSCRVLAAAYNRNPDLLLRKIRRVHLSAGTYPAGYLEWNVMLDCFAFQRIVESDLPLALYPCATPDGPFSLGKNNTFWSMPNLDWVSGMEPRLRRYLGFALQRVERMDFLRAMDEDWPELGAPGAFDPNFGREHKVWETCIWMEVADMRLVRRPDGKARLLPSSRVNEDDMLLSGGLRPVALEYISDGQVSADFRGDGHRAWLYERPDPLEQEAALREALPALYLGFRPFDEVSPSALEADELATTENALL